MYVYMYIGYISVSIYIYISISISIWTDAPVSKDEIPDSFLHLSFWLKSGMGEPGTLVARLSCPCALCLTWRRIGEEVHLGHISEDFRAGALVHLRSAFNELLDLREAHRAVVWGPLAGGTPAIGARKAPNTKAPGSGWE